MVLSLSPNSVYSLKLQYSPMLALVMCHSLIYESTVFQPWSVCVCVPLATKPPSAFCAYSKQLQAEAQSACFVHPSFVSVEQSPWTRLHLCLVALQAPWRQKGAPGSAFFIQYKYSINI